VSAGAEGYGAGVPGADGHAGVPGADGHAGVDGQTAGADCQAAAAAGGESQAVGAAGLPGEDSYAAGKPGVAADTQTLLPVAVEENLMNTGFLAQTDHAFSES